MKPAHRALLCASAIVAIMPALAMAQQAPAQDSSQALQEIVVTANRVETSAQKTPVALTVYSGADLAGKGVSNISALSTVDPSVNVSTNTGQSYVAIRGVASTDTTETGDPSVPIARDNFFTNRSYSITTSMYDLERVEVLKGPQGTLFGRNSTGGLIQIVTKKPGKELGADMSIEVGNYNAIKTEVGVNIPIGDKVQLRVAGFQSYHEGYRVIDGIGQRGDDDNTKSGRITLAFQPFEGFSGLIQYQHDDVNTTGDVAQKTAVGQPAPGGDVSHYVGYALSSNKLKGDRIRWEFTYQLPANLTLYYAGGYDHQQYRHVTDSTSVNSSGTITSYASQYYQKENPSTWNHEVRLATPQNGKFTAQIGYFHFEEHNANLDSYLHITSGANAGIDIIHFLYDVKSKSDGVFGQAGWRVTDTVKLTAGVRNTWDSKERTGQSVLNYAAFGGSGYGYTPANGSVSQSKPTFHLGAEWQATPRNMVYAKFDTGYKSGGFNSNGTAPSVNYGPETLKAWELGTKNKFAGGRIMLNADAFYQQYEGYQASQLNSLLGSSASGVFNIGNAEIYGLEGQFVAAITQGLKVDANATYLHARFKTHEPVYKADGNSYDIYNNQLPNAPDFVVTAGVEYAINLGGGTLTPRFEIKHSSSYYFDVFNSSDVRQGAFETMNANLKYTPASGRFTIMAFVRNLTNATVFSNAVENYSALPNPINGYEYQPPRTYGVRASAKF
ncbi:MAG TPA: TonB-dependent receptor [Novosphingobium sp.]|nr:TonB-dependent receptor [Novosphingobium sp.]